MSMPVSTPLRTAPVRYDLRSWLLTRDSKRIAILYLTAITLFYLAAALPASLLGIEALTPTGEFLEPETFGRLFTLHGQLAVFFFLLPALSAVLGNFMVPNLMGAENVAFPGINLVAWYAFALGGSLIVWSALNGGTDAGWSLSYLSGDVRAMQGIRVPAVGALLGATSAALVALNLIATVHRHRALRPRLGPFLVSQYACATVTLLVTPFFVAAIWLLLSGRTIPLAQEPDQALLYRTLFWAYAHPAVHAPLLVALGIITEIFASLSKTSPRRSGLVLGSIVAIALYGTLSFGQHLGREALGPQAWLLSALFGLLIAAPCVVIVLHWLALLLHGPMRWNAPQIYALAFVLVFSLGGVSGLPLAVPGLDASLHGTTFETAHFHYFVAGGILTAFLAGLHFWWPRLTGRHYPEVLARFSALGLLLGLNFAFLPRFFLGAQGLPARAHEYPASMQLFQVLSFAGSTILLGALLLPIAYLTWSFFGGPLAHGDPARSAELG